MSACCDERLFEDGEKQDKKNNSGGFGLCTVHLMAFNKIIHCRKSSVLNLFILPCDQSMLLQILKSIMRGHHFHMAYS
jgi:hypothetical protein